MSTPGLMGSPPRDADPAIPVPTVLAAFGVEPASPEIKIVEGGWSHQLWRVDTTDGLYVMKQMRAEPGDWWHEQLSAACAFELAAWSAGVVPMPEPIAVVDGDGLLAHFHDTDAAYVYRCHRWVDSSPTTTEAATVERSRTLGSIIAVLHRLDFPTDATTANGLPMNALDAFEETVEEASARSKPWASALGALAPLVEELRQEFRRLAGLELPLRFAHRDLDPKNVGRLGDGRVVVYDWDYSGPRLGEADVLDVALSFAGGAAAVVEECAVATVDEYRRTGLDVDFERAAPILVEEGFRWLMLNAWRSLGHRSISPAQVAFADKLIPGLATSWPTEAATIRALADRLAPA